MDFHSKTTLHSQNEVDDYLARYGVRLPSNIQMEWCPANTDFSVDPPVGGVYLHSQILVLGLRLPLTNLVLFLGCPLAVDGGYLAYSFRL